MPTLYEKLSGLVKELFQLGQVNRILAFIAL
jgi:hypothetical protein